MIPATHRMFLGFSKFLKICKKKFNYPTLQHTYRNWDGSLARNHEMTTLHFTDFLQQQIVGYQYFHFFTIVKHQISD